MGLTVGLMEDGYASVTGHSVKYPLRERKVEWFPFSSVKTFVFN